MTTPDPNKTDRALEDEDYEELLEIDEFGRIYQPDEAPRDTEKKPTILRDPKGEYCQ
jgi:hypothetical protein